MRSIRHVAGPRARLPPTRVSSREHIVGRTQRKLIALNSPCHRRGSTAENHLMKGR